jgi:DNA-directed RNA polymerase specialized sigma24 family protein
MKALIPKNPQNTPDMMNNIHSQAEKERFFIGLYKCAFPDFAAFIRKNGGTLEESRDVFQDSLLIYYEKIVSQQLPELTNQKAYLLGICKNLWYRKTGRQLFCQELTEPADYASPDELHYQNEHTDLLAFLEVAGQKCLEMLKSFYYDRSSLQAIAQSFGFASVRSATVQKYKCLEKVRDEVKQKSLTYEDFTY